MYDCTKQLGREQEMPRLSITLTESQHASLERIAATTGASKQSMISLAISQWLADYATRVPAPEGWYGYALITEPDPLSGRPDTYRMGEGGPFASREEAEAHAERVSAMNMEDGAEAVPRVEYVRRDRP